MVERRASEREAEHRFFPPPERLYLSLSAWRAALAAHPAIELEPLDVLAADERETRLSVHSFSTGDLQRERASTSATRCRFAPVADQVRAWRDEGQRVVFVAGTEPQTQRLARLLEANEIAATVVARPFAELVAGATAADGRRAAGVEIVLGHLSEGFRIPEERLVVVTEADIFGEARQRAARAACRRRRSCCRA